MKLRLLILSLFFSLGAFAQPSPKIVIEGVEHTFLKGKFVPEDLYPPETDWENADFCGKKPDLFDLEEPIIVIFLKGSNREADVRVVSRISVMPGVRKTAESQESNGISGKIIEVSGPCKSAQFTVIDL